MLWINLVCICEYYNICVNTNRFNTILTNMYKRNKLFTMDCVVFNNVTI